MIPAVLSEIAALILIKANIPRFIFREEADDFETGREAQPGLHGWDTAQVMISSLCVWPVAFMYSRMIQALVYTPCAPPRPWKENSSIPDSSHSQLPQVVHNFQQALQTFLRLQAGVNPLE